MSDDDDLSAGLRQILSKHRLEKRVIAARRAQGLPVPPEPPPLTAEEQAELNEIADYGRSLIDAIQRRRLREKAGRLADRIRLRRRRAPAADESALEVRSWVVDREPGRESETSEPVAETVSSPGQQLLAASRRLQDEIGGVHPRRGGAKRR